MARINLEDELKDDARFLKLVKLLDYEPALGAMVRVWVIAQRYWKKDKSYIPEPEWEKQSLNNAVIQVGLAVRRENGIYVCGSEEHFAWLWDRVEAGRKGGSKTSDAKRDAARKNALKRKEAVIIKQIDHKQNEANPSKTKQNEPSYSYSISEREKENNMSTEREHAAEASENSTGHDAQQELISTKPKKLSPEDLLSIWNDLKPTACSAVKHLSTDRETKARARLKEHPEVEFWEDVMGKIEASKFLKGEVQLSERDIAAGKRVKPWRVDFDWLIKPGNAARVSEGKYDR